MTRDVTDADGTAWTVAQAFAGLGSEDAERTDAARVKGAPDRVHVVCTPSGGARSVRIQLPKGWADSATDEEIAAAIHAAAAATPPPR